MNGDPSILHQLESAGRAVPRVRLDGGEAPAGVAPSTERYEIVGEIARGGVGVVFKGRDTDLGRDVALKVLREEHATDPELVERFVEEAQIGGQLQHPGIVPVYELGVRPDRRPYFAMKLVKGRTLADLLAQRKDPTQDRRALLGWFAQACHTVAYAHSRGVIHRDLKPSNVMVGAFGEVQVVDWGFAKVLRRGGVEDERRAQRDATIVATVRTAVDGTASMAGSVMGTPAYMPPEQALGQVEHLTEQADVFSLGAMLCEILTGEPPYTGTPAEVYALAAHARLQDAWARLEASSSDAELVALTKACLSALPKDRPRNAREVAETLSTFLAEGERRAHAAKVRAVRAEAEVLERRRARRTTWTLSCAVLLLVAAGGAALLALGNAAAARDRERGVAYEAAVLEATRLSGSDAASATRAAERAVDLAGEDAGRRADAQALLTGVTQKFEAARLAAKKAARETEVLARLDEVLLGVDPDADWVSADGAFAAALPGPIEVEGFDRRVELACYLDCWVNLLRFHRPVGVQDWRALDDTARRLDPDPWRMGLREAVAAGDFARLRALAADPASQAQGVRSRDMLGGLLCSSADPGDQQAGWDVLTLAAETYPADSLLRAHLAGFAAAWDPRRGVNPRMDVGLAHALATLALAPTKGRAYLLVGHYLVHSGNRQRGIAYYREGLRLSPRVAHGHVKLGVALTGEGDHEGAIAAHREALRLNPDYPMAHAQLGAALFAKGDFDGALAAFREALRGDPNVHLAHVGIADILNARGDLDGAIVAWRECVRTDPDDAEVHVGLAHALFEKGELDGSIAASREVLRIDPKHAVAHLNLVSALCRKGDLDGALPVSREAVRLNPERWEAHLSLASVLALKGELDGCIAACRETLRINPQNATAHNNLSFALGASGDLVGAIAASREAVRLDPQNAHYHESLAVTLSQSGDVVGAIAAYRELIRVNPTRGPAYSDLARLLTQTGDFAGALAAQRRAVGLSPGLPGLAERLAKAEQLAAAHARLPAVLRGEDTPATGAEWAALATTLYYTKDYATSARYSDTAFTVDPHLANDLGAEHRYNAACAAVLAGGEWHDRALAWLRADLVLWGLQLKSDPQRVAGAMRHWKADSDLTSVRDAANLSEAWKQLWADVDALLARVPLQDQR